MKPDPDPSAEYAAEVQRLENAPPPSAGATRRGIDAFKKFYSSITEESVKELTAETYAPDAFFNDSLKTVRGSKALEEYFTETAKNTERVSATVVDVAESNGNVYVRWEMEIEFAKFKQGRINRSIGMTHLRFDDEGRIVLHQDFWDAAGGFYEHVPVLGGGIRWIKRML